MQASSNISESAQLENWGWGTKTAALPALLPSALTRLSLSTPDFFFFRPGFAPVAGAGRFLLSAASFSFFSGASFPGFGTDFFFSFGSFFFFSFCAFFSFGFFSLLVGAGAGGGSIPAAISRCSFFRKFEPHILFEGPTHMTVCRDPQMSSLHVLEVCQLTKQTGSFKIMLLLVVVKIQSKQ